MAEAKRVVLREKSAGRIRVTTACTHCGSLWDAFWYPGLATNHYNFKACADCAARRWQREIQFFSRAG